MALTCKNINKAFGSVVALKNVSLSVEKGEVRALFGGNGSGKSTLAKIIGGSVKPDSGAIEIDGERYIVNSPIDAKKKRIIVTSQELSLFSNLTVIENICLCKIPKKGILADKKRVIKMANEVLEKMNLGYMMDMEVKALHSNEQYLLEFAKALIQKPEMLIIDEITSALFKKDVEMIKEIINELKAQGCMILFISHRMPEIYSICDTVTVMRNGESVADLDLRKEIINEKELISHMSGRTITDEQIGFIETDQNDKEKHVGIVINDMFLHSFNTKINMSIKEGTVVGIAGLQGHGQSTLVRQLFGLYSPVNITIGEKKCHITSAKKAVQEGIAFISGNRETEGVFSEQSIQENINVVTDIVLKQKKTDVRELLDQYKVVYDTPLQKLTNLSGGISKRWLSEDGQQPILRFCWPTTLQKGLMFKREMISMVFLLIWLLKVRSY